jgi:hypothetical protein
MVGTGLDPSLTADEAGQLAMMQIVMVGLGASAAAALLFASVASGSLLAVLLFNLAPLPLLIAALGWSHRASLVAGVGAAAALGLALGFHYFAAFLFGVALPAWWLGYLSLLARPIAANGGAPSFEWYPVGRLVLWAAIIAAILIAFALPNFGDDKENFQAALRSAFERALKQTPAETPALRADTERMIGLVASAILPVAAMIATLISTLNLWLAARIVRVSNRLRRPWPDLSAITLPAVAPALFAAAIAGTFLPDLAGTMAGVAAASLLMVFALLGFAVMHVITRGMDHRTLALAGVYGVSIVFLWPLLAMALLGLIETAFHIRARVAAKRGPPSVRV